MTSGQYFGQMNMIFGGLVMNLLIIAAIGFAAEMETDPEFGKLIMFVALGMSVVLFPLGNFIFSNTIRKIPDGIKLSSRLNQYRSASLIRAALIEFPGILLVIGFWFSKNYLYLLPVLLFAFVILYILRPTAFKIAKDLSLTPEEADRLNDPKSMIDENAS